MELIYLLIHLLVNLDKLLCARTKVEHSPCPQLAHNLLEDKERFKIHPKSLG